MYNIFNNIHVLEYTEKAVKKYLRSPKNFSSGQLDEGEKVIYGFDALVKELDDIIAWQEKGRSGYECSCGRVFESDCTKLEKIDCWYQAHANIKMITHEVIRQYKEQLKKDNLQKSKEFVHEFNKNKITDKYSESCRKAAKLFRERTAKEGEK